MSRAMKLLPALAIVVMPLTGTADISAAAPPTFIEPYISVLLDGPTPLTSDVDVHVTRNGVDMTDEACGEVNEPQDGRRTVLCDDLPDGTYGIELDGVPDGATVRFDCTDIVATRAEPDALVIDGGVPSWGCFATIAPPSILITAGPDDVFDPVLLDVDGNEVACQVDDLPFEQRRWCDTPPGTYRIDPASIDPIFADHVDCSDFAVGGFFDLDGIVVSDTTHVVTCTQQPINEASIDVVWFGGENETAPWFDELMLRLLDETGQTVDAPCTEGDQANGLGHRRVVFRCVIGAGTFSAEIIGIPADQSFQSAHGATCPPEVSAPGQQLICRIEMVSPARLADRDGGDAPIDVDRLPDTGGATMVLNALAASLVVAGWALLASTRRRVT